MPRNPRTILIADDEPLICTFLQDIFTDPDFSVLTAENGLTAWNLFQHKHPDLVIADMPMPQMDDLTLTGQIREISPVTPVIIMSGAGTMDEVPDRSFSGSYLDAHLKLARIMLINHEYFPDLFIVPLQKTIIESI